MKDDPLVYLQNVHSYHIKRIERLERYMENISERLKGLEYELKKEREREV